MTKNFEEICWKCRCKMAGGQSRIVSSRFAKGENCDRCGEPIRMRPGAESSVRRKSYKVMV